MAQYIYTLEKERPDYVVILSGDHIYKTNYDTLVQFHKDTNADLTISALRVPADQSRHFGVIETDSGDRVVGASGLMERVAVILQNIRCVWLDLKRLLEVGNRLSTALLMRLVPTASVCRQKITPSPPNAGFVRQRMSASTQQ